jgi:glutaredoxin-related protein
MHQVFLDLRNQEKETALHLAARCGNLEALNMLIEAGASLNRNIEGKTAIDIARMGNAQAVTVFQRVEVKIYMSGISSTMTVRANTESIRQLLAVKKIRYEEVDLSMTPERLQEMESKSKTRVLPQLFVNGIFIGGADDVQLLEDDQVLDKIMFGQLKLVDKNEFRKTLQPQVQIKSSTAMLLESLGLSLQLLQD